MQAITNATSNAAALKLDDRYSLRQTCGSGDPRGRSSADIGNSRRFTVWHRQEGGGTG
jgi:hypothetical protein